MIKIFKPIGLLDGIQAKKLRLEINAAITAGIKIMLIDMQGVTSIDSSALSELVAILKAIRARGGKLCLCSVGQQPKMIFELAGIDRMFHIFHNQDDFYQHEITAYTSGEVASISREANA